MKHLSKICALLMALCLLVSLLAIPASAAGYVQPKFKIGKFESRPNLDGKLDDECWAYATARELSYERIAAGEGWLWPPFWGIEVTQDTQDFKKDDGEGWFYLGWDEDYFYFAFEVDDEKNTNNQAISDELWKGDNIQMQIGANALAERFELGFAISQFGGTRPLGHQWEPIARDFTTPVKGVKMTAATNDPVLFFVGRDEKKKLTTYEVAISLSYVGAKAGSVGNKIPFAFSQHMYSTDGNGNGYFIEWADGVIGNATTKDLSVAAILEFAEANTKVNEGPCGKNYGEAPPTETTTTQRTTVIGTTKPGTTKPGTTGTTKPGTTAPQGNNNVVTTAPQGGNNNVVTAAPTTTTAAPTTTTTAPEVAGTEFFDAQKAVDVDDADVLEKLGKDFEGIEISAKKYTVKEKNFGVFSGETLKGVFVKDGRKYVALEGKEEEIEGSKWMIYEVEVDTEVYVVEEVIPTTTPAPTTTTEAEVVTTEADATTTAATTKAADTATTEPASNGWIVWVIVAVAVLAAAAVVVIIILKKKNAAPTEE